MSTRVTFRNFMRLNGVKQPIQSLNSTHTNFSGLILVQKLKPGGNESRALYNLTLKCVNGLTAEQFLISSDSNLVVLDANQNGIPNRFVLTSKGSNGKFKFKAELILSEDGNATHLKFYLPPSGVPVNREEDLTDIREAGNDLQDSALEIADEETVGKALAEEPLVAQAFNSAEFHLNLALETMRLSLSKAKIY